MSSIKLTGRCLCGAVVFSLDRGAFNDRTACHCSQCRRWSGHLWASVSGPTDLFSIDAGEDKVRWHHSSDVARRGFCSECGSSLFWHGCGVEEFKDRIAVAFGALDEPTHARLEKHIFVADKGDYYEIADGLPQPERE
ncbi:MAG: GFA family protein [Pseudomonadota bacterium]